jgi:hypothetical protein
MTEGSDAGHQQIFNCGDSKYYVSEQNSFLVVQRQDWIERTFVGYARDIAEAISLIRRDAGSGQIRAA